MTGDDVDLPRFERSFLGCGSRLTRIGSGAVGGKAAGLCRVERKVLPRLDDSEFLGFEVDVPHAVILTTEVFDAFVRRNAIEDFVLGEHPDDHIAHVFQKADMPAEYVGDLRALIGEVHTPPRRSVVKPPRRRPRPPVCRGLRHKDDSQQRY